MTRGFAALLVLAVAAMAPLVAPARAQTLVKVAWCGPVIHSAASPFAIAEKMGWFAQGGITVRLVAMGGSADCVKQVATGDLPFGIASPEALGILRPQGIKIRTFYTAYQSSTYGLAVPVDSPIHTFQDLKGKTIGVSSMGSGGVVIARALVSDAGLNPDTDIRIVVAGEGAQTAALLRDKQLDALSQFDAAYALVETTGVKLRMMDNSKIEHFPANGLVALESTLIGRRADAVALGRGISMGAIFALANPKAATRILWEVYPQTKPTGKDEATALAEGAMPMRARAHAFLLAPAGVTKWGENSEANYEAYFKFLYKWGVLKQPVDGKDVIDNSLIDDINKFDAAAVETMAKNYQ
jgi:NitT/TauT family transport system substrate-binding protein